MNDDPAPSERFSDLDGLRNPVSRSILTALSCAPADVRFLRRLIGVPDERLTTHLSQLSGAGLVEVEASAEEERPTPIIRLSDKGRRLLKQHGDDLTTLLRHDGDTQANDARTNA